MRGRLISPNELTPADVAGWSKCAARSLEPNPFLEPNWLLPALKYLDEAPATKLVLAESGNGIQAVVPIMEITADQGNEGGHGKHAAVKTRVAPTAISLGTPLVTAEGGPEALVCVMEEIKQEAERQQASLVIMEWVGYDGPTARLFKQAAVAADSVLIEFDTWERGFLRRQGGDGEDYWLRNIGKNRRRTIGQHRRQLAGTLGTTPHLRTRTDGDAVDAFLRLEASGWKGHQPDGLALWSQAATTRFFEEVCDRYISEGRMSFLALEGDGVPIAMICCVRAGEGLFAYRTAYDEDLARYGPGVEVFLAAMEYFDRETDARWLDTCSTRDNSHLLGLFPDRRLMATVMFRVPGADKAGHLALQA